MKPEDYFEDAIALKAAEILGTIIWYENLC